MRYALKEMRCRFEKLGITWADLGGRIGKEAPTAMRQLDLATANPTLDTLELYATALNGTIHFVPAELDFADQTEKIIALSQQLGAVKKENEMLLSRIEKQDALLEKRLSRINDLQDLLTEVIHKLLERIP